MNWITVLDYNYDIYLLNLSSLICAVLFQDEVPTILQTETLVFLFWQCATGLGIIYPLKLKLVL